jgi:hypothetical protein
VFRDLDEDHGGSDESSLTDESNAVLGHRLQEGQGLLHASSSAGDTEGKGSSIPDVRVIRLSKERH